jgi:hypothetical protein
LNSQYVIQELILLGEIELHIWSQSFSGRGHWFLNILSHLAGEKNQGIRNEEKIIYSYISLQIISKGYAKILETLKTFPLLFSTFSFPFSIFTIIHSFEKKN